MPKSFSELSSASGKSLIESTYISATSHGNGTSAAIIAGYQDIPATEYHKGVLISVVEFESLDIGISRGIYIFRVTACQEITALGQHKAVAELLDASGKTVHSWENTLTVFSLTIPADRSSREVVIDLTSVSSKDFSGQFKFIGWKQEVCCKNGVCGTCICPTLTCPTPDS